MVVDDSVSVRRVMSNLLKNSGWSVLDAKDGLDVVEKLQSAEHRRVRGSRDWSRGVRRQ